MVSSENPGISFGEVGKALGAKWAEADEKTKKARGGRPPAPAAPRGGATRRAGPARGLLAAAQAPRPPAQCHLPGARVG